MSKKIISHVNLSDTLHLSELSDGFWLYDDTRGMNLAMSSKTSEAAFTAALTYYQERLKKVEGELHTLQDRVNGFVQQFIDDED